MSVDKNYIFYVFLANSSKFNILKCQNKIQPNLNQHAKKARSLQECQKNDSQPTFFSGTAQVLTSFFHSKRASLCASKLKLCYNTKNKQIANNEYFVNQQKVDGWWREKFFLTLVLNKWIKRKRRIKKSENKQWQSAFCLTPHTKQRIK